MSLYRFSVTLHLLAALLWLGGMFFLAAVGAPVLRQVEPASLRTELFRRIGERFRSVGWVAIVALVTTGLGNLHFRGFLGPALAADPALWATPFGRALAWKLGAVLVMLVIQAVHDFVEGPRASGLDPGTPAALASRRRAAWLARSNAIVGVLLVFVAVWLARGG